MTILSFIISWIFWVILAVLWVWQMIKNEQLNKLLSQTQEKLQRLQTNNSCYCDILHRPCPYRLDTGDSKSESENDESST